MSCKGEYMKSLWENIEKPDFDLLQGDIRTDVLVIGGGLCGILCAHMLKNAGVDCVLVEADKICSGITKNTTAKITFQHGLIYSKTAENYGEEKAFLYYKSQKHAFEMMLEMMADKDVDFEICNSFVYSLNDKGAIEKETEVLDKIGCNAIFCDKTELPFSVAGAVMIENQAKFHPLKFAYATARNLKIYENTKVLSLNGTKAITENGTVTAKKIIVATHFPFINKHGWYFLKMYQHRSYVVALENAQDLNGMYVDEAQNGLSLRTYGNLLLLGGGSHRTGKQGGNWEELQAFAKKYYSGSREITRWATQDCIALDSIPYIGRYSKSTPDLYVATGFNKWGMTSSMISAIILTDMICKGKSEYEDVYSPSRSIFHPQLAVNMAESLKGILTLRTPRCPHLGCALEHNKQEHSWDCPCHGSRFNENGKLIDNPAVKDKEM